MVKESKLGRRSSRRAELGERKSEPRLAVRLRDLEDRVSSSPAVVDVEFVGNRTSSPCGHDRHGASNTRRSGPPRADHEPAPNNRGHC